MLGTGRAEAADVYEPRDVIEQRQAEQGAHRLAEHAGAVGHEDRKVAAQHRDERPPRAGGLAHAPTSLPCSSAKRAAKRTPRSRSGEHHSTAPSRASTPP